MRGTTLLADAIASSVDEHARFGGVVPEVASRAHLEAMVPTMQRALDTAGVDLSDVDAIAVTAGPGLAGALLVGRGRGQGLRARRREAALRRQPPRRARRRRHARARRRCPSPAIALLVSGGHSSLLLVDDLAPRRDAARRDRSTTRPARPTTRSPGCSGLPFPGGPPIDRAAATGDPAAIAFPRGLTAPQDRPSTASTSRSPA